MTWEDDAREFGTYMDKRLKNWRQGLLAARSVAPDTGHGGDRRSAEFQRGKVPVETNDQGKTAARYFAEKAGIDHHTVINYRDTWNRAAKDGVVPPADELKPTTEVDIGGLPPWKDYYQPTAEEREKERAKKRKKEEVQPLGAMVYIAEINTRLRLIIDLAKDPNVIWGEEWVKRDKIVKGLYEVSKFAALVAEAVENPAGMRFDETEWAELLK